MYTILVTKMWPVLFQFVSWPCFSNVHYFGDKDVACLISEGELSWCLMCNMLVTMMWPVLFQLVCWPGLNVHFPGSNLSCFRM